MNQQHVAEHHFGIAAKQIGLAVYVLARRCGEF